MSTSPTTSPESISVSRRSDDEFGNTRWLSRLARRQANHVLTETPLQQTNLYVPNANPIFDALYRIEERLVSQNEQLSRFVAANIMNCRIYYAFAFHLMILLTRQRAGVADSDEIQVIQRIDEELHIKTLPIFDDLFDIFRLIFVHRKATSTRYAIAPESQTFATFQFEHQNGKDLAPLNCYVPGVHATQPSLTLGVHRIRWDGRKLETPDDDDVPNAAQRLNYLANGLDTPFVPADPNSDDHEQSILQRLFVNPLFRRPVPIRGSLNKDIVTKMMESDPPQNRWNLRPNAQRKHILFRELLIENDIHWLQHIKYSASTLAHLHTGICFLSETLLPYTDSEIGSSFLHHDRVSSVSSEVGYMGPGHWMALFERDVDGPI